MRRIELSQIDSLSVPEKVTLKNIYDNIASEFEVSTIILFGSKARGDHNEHSDVDVLILLEEASSKIISKVRDIVVHENMENLTDIRSIIRDKKDWYSKEFDFPKLIENINEEGLEIVFY